MKQDHEKNNSGMVIFTIAVCVVLVAMMASAFLYLFQAKDFVPPAEVAENKTESGTDDSKTEESESEETELEKEELLSVWDVTMDDLIAYLDALGFIDAADGSLMSTVGSENYVYNGIDIIWWDVENLVEGTEEYDNWTQLTENGYILLYGSTIYTPIQNGPFAICATMNFPGDTDALYEAFQNFPTASE